MLKTASSIGEAISNLATVAVAEIASAVLQDQMIDKPRFGSIVMMVGGGTLFGVGAWKMWQTTKTSTKTAE